MHGSVVFAVCWFVEFLRHEFRECTEIRPAASLHLKPLYENVKNGHYSQTKPNISFRGGAPDILELRH